MGTIIGSFIAIFTFFYKLIIHPLSEAIKELKNMLREIKDDIKRENERRSSIEIRLSILEEKIEHLGRA